MKWNQKTDQTEQDRKETHLFPYGNYLTISYICDLCMRPHLYPVHLWSHALFHVGEIAIFTLAAFISGRYVLGQHAQAREKPPQRKIRDFFAS